jgi:hypothetical protein
MPDEVAVTARFTAGEIEPGDWDVWDGHGATRLSDRYWTEAEARIRLLVQPAWQGRTAVAPGAC